MILCDLPYGTTRNKWDVIIPLEPLWAQYRRIIKSNGVIALHSDMPFTAALVSAGKNLYRYELIWVKENGSDFLNANRKPLKAHESSISTSRPITSNMWTESPIKIGGGKGERLPKTGESFVTAS